MRPSRDEVKWVAQFIVIALTVASKPVTRDELTDDVAFHTGPALGVHWKRTTAARRVRDALVLLLDTDTPVISAGGGFKLASRATAAERDRAARLIEQQLIKLTRKLHKVRGFRLPGEPADGELFPGARP